MQVYDLRSKKAISEFIDLSGCKQSEGAIYNELNGQIHKIQSSNFEVNSVNIVSSVYPNLSWSFQVNEYNWVTLSILTSLAHLEVQSSAVECVLLQNI